MAHGRYFAENPSAIGEIGTTRQDLALYGQSKSLPLSAEGATLCSRKVPVYCHVFVAAIDSSFFILLEQLGTCQALLKLICS